MERVTSVRVSDWSGLVGVRRAVSARCVHLGRAKHAVRGQFGTPAVRRQVRQLSGRHDEPHVRYERVEAWPMRSEWPICG
eukprot:11944922-Alexandrium_andersonii.AAC.1